MNEEKYIKDFKEITSEYIVKLREYILNNQRTFFKKENEADAWCDFDQWKDSKTDRNHLILPNELMLVDRSKKGAYEHAYCICSIGKDRKIKKEIFVVNVWEIDRLHWRNGYFLLPKL